MKYLQRTSGRLYIPHPIQRKKYVNNKEIILISVKLSKKCDNEQKKKKKKTKEEIRCTCDIT